MKNAKLLDRVSNIKDTLYRVITEIVPQDSNLPATQSPSGGTVQASEPGTLEQSLDLKLPKSLGSRPVVIVQNQTSVVNNVVLVNIVNALRELDQIHSDVIEAEFEEKEEPESDTKAITSANVPEESISALVDKLARSSINKHITPSNILELLRKQMFIICFEERGMTNREVAVVTGLSLGTVCNLKKKYGLTQPHGDDATEYSTDDDDEEEGGNWC